MAGRLIIVALILSASLTAQINLSRQAVYTITTVAGLPASPPNGDGTPYLVQDSADGSCTTGGGSKKVICTRQSGAWVAYGGSQVNTFTSTTTFSDPTYSALFTGGPVGIGTATPGAALQVVSTTSADQLRVGYDTTNYYKIGRNSADGVLHFQGTQATYNGYNFLSQAGTSSFFIKATGSVGIGTAAPDASAILDLTSTTGALLIPRMTTTQRDALTAENGMLIYNTTLNKFEGYENGAWASLI